MATTISSISPTPLPSTSSTPPSTTSSGTSPLSLSGVGTLSSPGVGSNLDVNSIITKLMQVESQPLTQMDTQEASYQAELSSYGTLQGAFSSLQSAAQALAALSASNFTTNSSDTASVSGTASSTAASGTHIVNVTQLAQTQMLVAAGQASTASAIGSGSSTTVTLTFGTISGGTLTNGTYSGASFTPNAARSPVNITIDATNNTLQGIANAINAANAGVTASIINDGSGTPYRLALNVTASGAANSVKIGISGDAAIASLLGYDPTGAQQLVQTQAAQNAALTVDGVPITSQTNTVSGAITGVSLSLGQVTSSPVIFSVSRDFSAAQSALSAFVQAYNDFNSAFATATAKGAVLQGDGGVLGVQSDLSSLLISGYGSSLNYNTLPALGISVQEDGSLQFDSTKLTTALAADPAGTIAALTGAGNAVNSLATSALGPDGVFQASADGINQQIADLDARRTEFQNHLDQVQQQYQLQFAALDAMISSMTQTSTFLQQQFFTLPSQVAGSTSKTGG